MKNQQTASSGRVVRARARGGRKGLAAYKKEDGQTVALTVPITCWLVGCLPGEQVTLMTMGVW